MTSTPREAGDNTPRQVRQIEQALRRVYLEPELVDASDLEGRSDEERETRLLSRALAAQAVRMATGLSPEAAALTVVDGYADQGIDAIAVIEQPEAHVFLVQAKWSKTGNARSDRSAVQELLAGLRFIDDEEFAQFNPRAQPLAERAKNVISQGTVKVTQVIALMRADEVTPGFRHAIESGETEFNRHGDLLDHRIILARDVWTSIRQDQAPAPIALEAKLFPWFNVTVPYESYQGVVTADQVSSWARNGTNLFNLNIRDPLGRTAINNELIETLITEPANFWYYNNGITILCESVTKSLGSPRNPHAHPIDIKLHNASVVNGAQTVRSVADAIAVDADAESAQVGVRIIVTGAAADFAKSTTQATNRQNRVEARDFVSLDPIQAAIMDELRAELNLTYSVRRSDLDPHPDTGCSVVEAACALACAHSQSKYAARIAHNLDVLWERGGQGIYDYLFRPQPSAYLIWNTVAVHREVRKQLHGLRSRYEGRGAALIEHGSYLIAHLVFRCIDTEVISDPDPDLDWQRDTLGRIPDLVAKLLPATAAAIDAMYGRRQIQVVCSDIQSCREIVSKVLRELGSPTPDVYRRNATGRKRRSPNAVTVLINNGVLAEGEPLALSKSFPKEYDAIKHWLSQDPNREKASWVLNSKRPLLWAADGKLYSPSGLVSHMWEEAGWEQRPVANQGTARWVTRSGQSLVSLARQKLRELSTTEEGEDD